MTAPERLTRRAVCGLAWGQTSWASKERTELILMMGVDAI